MVISTRSVIVFALMKKRLENRYLPALAWAVAITIVSSIPYLSTPNAKFGYVDKIAHFCEYFILGLLTAHAVRGFRVPLRIFAVSAALASLYGVLDELHQLIVPGRSVEAWDMIADVLGAVLASALYVSRYQRRFARGTQDRSKLK